MIWINDANALCEAIVRKLIRPTGSLAETPKAIRDTVRESIQADSRDFPSALTHYGLNALKLAEEILRDYFSGKALVCPENPHWVSVMWAPKYPESTQIVVWTQNSKGEPHELLQLTEIIALALPDYEEQPAVMPKSLVGEGL